MVSICVRPNDDIPTCKDSNGIIGLTFIPSIRSEHVDASNKVAGKLPMYQGKPITFSEAM